MKFNQLKKIIANRIKFPKNNSYVSGLIESGSDRVLQKIGEESFEVVLAGKNDNKSELICELSDLIFHIIILMEIKKISFKDLYYELEKRHLKKKRDVVSEQS